MPFFFVLRKFFVETLAVSWFDDFFFVFLSRNVDVLLRRKLLFNKAPPDNGSERHQPLSHEHRFCLPQQAVNTPVDSNRIKPDINFTPVMTAPSAAKQNNTRLRQCNRPAANLFSGQIGGAEEESSFTFFHRSVAAFCRTTKIKIYHLVHLARRTCDRKVLPQITFFSRAQSFARKLRSKSCLRRGRAAPSSAVFVCLIAICCACMFTITNNTCIWWIHIWCQGQKRRKQTIMDRSAFLMRQMHRELTFEKVNSNFAFTFLDSLELTFGSSGGCFWRNCRGFSSDFPRPADWLSMSSLLTLPKHAENTTSRLIKINACRHRRRGYGILKIFSPFVTLALSLHEIYNWTHFVDAYD